MAEWAAVIVAAIAAAVAIWQAWSASAARRSAQDARAGAEKAQAAAVVAQQGSADASIRIATAVEAARFANALDRVITAIPARMEALYAYESQLTEIERIVPGGDTEDGPREPAPYELGVLLEAAQMAAEGDDRRVMDEVAAAFYAIIGLPPSAQRARLSALPGMIRKWRAGEYTDAAWAVFTRFAESAEKGTGMTPPPKWDPELHRR